MVKKLKILLSFKAYKELYRYTENSLGSVILITLLNIITSLSGILIALITKSMIDFAVGGKTSLAIKYGIVFAALLFITLLLSSYVSIITVQTRESMKIKIQQNILSTIYGKKWISLNAYKTGDLLTRVYDDVIDIVEVWITVFPSLISLLLQLVGAYIILSFYDPILALLAFLVSPITIIISYLIGRKLKEVQKQMQIADSSLRSFINESLQNIIILKTFEYTDKNLSITSNLQQNKFNLVKQKNHISVKSNLLLGLGYRFGFFGAIAFGAYRLSTKAITFGTFTAFLQLVAQIQGPIGGLSRTIPQIITSIASVERLTELANLEDDNIILPLSDNGNVPNDIFIEKLTFGYTKDVKVLKDIDLHIRAGEKIALIGTSGEGKTTLIHILLSLIEPNAGKMSMQFSDDSLISLSSHTRRYFSYVPQSNSLFSGSIKDNLLISNPDANEDEINNALITSCSLNFINELPKGLDSIIGERGIGLSQGQAQRLSIARALLRNKPFLIFDEATSALDMDTERDVIKNLKIYYPNTTVIAITHRDSIFQICDKVFLLKNGHMSIV